MRKAEQSERTRSALVLAAIRLFGERGYRATSLKAVGEEARISHGVIPFHFGSKEGLLLAVVEHCFETYRREVFGALGGRERDFGLGDLDALIEALLGFHEHHPDVGRLFQVLMFEALSAAPELRAHFVEFHRRVTQLGIAWMQAGQASGTLRAELDVEGTVEAVFSFFTGARAHSLLFTEDDPGARRRVFAAMGEALRLGVQGARAREESA